MTLQWELFCVETATIITCSNWPHPMFQIAPDRGQVETKKIKFSICYTSHSSNAEHECLL